MNFTYTLTKAPDGKWGNIQPDGSWNGMVGISDGMLKKGTADIAVADLTITSARSKVVDFLPTLLDFVSLNFS